MRRLTILLALALAALAGAAIYGFAQKPASMIVTLGGYIDPDGR